MARARVDDDDPLGFLFSDVAIVGAIALFGYGAWMWYQQQNAAAGTATSPAGPPGPAQTSQSTDDMIAPAPATSSSSAPPSNVMIFPPPATSSTSTTAAQLQPGQFVVSAAGEQFIKNIETLRLTKYRDGAGYSIGWGHQIQSGDGIGNTITAARADQLFEQDLAKVEQAMNARIMVPLTQGQVDALADWIYNVGIGAFESSTLLRDLNAGNYAAASSELSRWTHSNGQPNKTLVARRQADQQLFGSA